MATQNPLKFTSLRIERVPPFHMESIEFDFDPRVNVFIGPNATGKSTILREMAFRGGTSEDPRIFGKSEDDGLPKLTDVPHIYLPPIRNSFREPNPGDYELLYVPGAGQKMGCRPGLPLPGNSRRRVTIG